MRSVIRDDQRVDYRLEGDCLVIQNSAVTNISHRSSIVYIYPAGSHRLPELAACNVPSANNVLSADSRYRSYSPLPSLRIPAHLLLYAFDPDIRSIVTIPSAEVECRIRNLALVFANTSAYILPTDTAPRDPF